MTTLDRRGGQAVEVDPELEGLGRLSDADLAAVDAWWRANNYLAVGQIHLQANPLLRERLLAGGRVEGPGPVGTWGPAVAPVPGQEWRGVTREVLR